MKGNINSIVEIKNVIGNVKGRDGIYLDSYLYVDNCLIIEGEINSSLCSIKHKSRWIKFVIEFEEVKFYQQVIPED